jgi:hypothetical protein
MKLTNSIKTLVTQIVARDVAAGVELARSLGYSMPKDFDVGVSFHEEYDGRTRIQLRLDDARYAAIVQLPHLDGRLSIKSVDAMWQKAWTRIHADALTVAQVWIDKHPEAHPKDATKTLAILDVLRADDVLHEKWITACEERARAFRYSQTPRDVITEIDGTE